MEVELKGSILRTLRKSKGIRQDEVAKYLEVDVSTISRLERGEIINLDLLEKMAGFLQHHTEKQIMHEEDTAQKTFHPLRVGFVMSTWAAPLIWLNDQNQKDLFDKMQLTCYKDKNNQLHFSSLGKKLTDPLQHEVTACFSGEIKQLVKEGQLDIGFLGAYQYDASDVEIVRIGRIIDNIPMRHYLKVITPFPQDEQTLFQQLKSPSDETLAKTTFYFHENSTGQEEFNNLFLPLGYDYEVVTVFTPTFEETMLTHIAKNFEQGKMIVFLSALVTSSMLMKVVHKGGFHVYSFECADFEEQPTKKLSYEIIAQRDTTKLNLLKTDERAILFFKRIQNALNELNRDIYKKAHGIPFPHKRTAEFLFNMDARETSDSLKELQYELVFYPEWVIDM